MWENSTYILVGVSLKWLVSETPYLVHEAAKAPHVTGCGVLLVVECLRSRPLDGDLATTCEVIALLLQVSRHPKITDLRQ